jgi:hypothetical protein
MKYYRLEDVRGIMKRSLSSGNGEHTFIGRGRMNGDVNSTIIFGEIRAAYFIRLIFMFLIFCTKKFIVYIKPIMCIGVKKYAKLFSIGCLFFIAFAYVAAFYGRPFWTFEPAVMFAVVMPYDTASIKR